MVLGESLYECDQATSDTSLEYDEFERSYDEYVEISRRATHCFDVVPKIFDDSYIFKRRGILSTLGIFKPKSAKRHARLMSMNFNPMYLRENPLPGGSLMWSKPQRSIFSAKITLRSKWEEQ